MKLNKPLILFVILLLFVTGGYFFYKEGTLPVNKESKASQIFVIAPGETLDSIAKKLSNENLIRNRVVFYLVVKQQGYEKKIQAGDFRLSPSMDVYEIAKSLTHGTLDKWVTIIEGLRKEEIAEIVAKDFNISEVDFVQSAPEGFLFPDTYLIPSQATAQTIISILTNTFEKRYTEFVEEPARQLGLTKNQIVTMASLVEREARTESDRKVVASIILKRMKNDWPLQIDATIQYAIGYQSDGKTWWKKALSVDDLKLKSAYNTYVNSGLPPAPICNPSLSSLVAVANANADTPYWYYLADLTGKTHFAKTLEEHDANVEKYLR